MKPAGLLILFLNIVLQSFSDSAPQTTIESTSACPGSEVICAVSVSGFTNISALSLRIDYNPTEMVFDTAININPLLSGMIVNSVNISPTLRKIMIVWASVNPVTLNNGDHILDLDFDYITGNAILAFNNQSNGGSDCEYADPDGNPLTDTPTASYYFNGTVSQGLSEGGSVSGSKTIVYGQNTGTLTLTGYAGDILTWQKKYNDGNYSDIQGTAGQTGYSEIPDYTGTWLYRAVVSYDTCSQDYSDTAVIMVNMPANTTRTWTGATDDDWIHPGNWNPGGVPDSTEKIIIPSAALNMPKVKNAGIKCNKVEIFSNASLLIVSGSNLKILSHNGLGPTDYVAYWPLDGNFNDVSGNNHHATVTGTLNFVTGINGSGVTNFISQSYITLPNLNLSTGSLSAWVLFNQHATQKVLRSEGTSLCIGEWAGGWEACGSCSLPVTLNIWHHFAIVDGQGLYLDGSLLYPSATGCDASINVLTYVGGPPYAEWLNGIVDDIKWYNRVLTSAEIQQLATPPPEEK